MHTFARHSPNDTFHECKHIFEKKKTKLLEVKEREKNNENITMIASQLNRILKSRQSAQFSFFLFVLYCLFKHYRCVLTFEMI